MIEAVATSVYPSQDGNANTSNGSNHQHTSSSNGCGSKSSLSKCVSNIIHKGFQKRKSSIEDGHVNFSRRDNQTTASNPHVHHREQHHPYMDSSYSIHSAHKKSSQEMAQPASASKGEPSTNAGPAVAVDQPSSTHETINDDKVDHANKNSLMSRILKKRRNTVFFPSNIAKLEEMTQQQPESPTGLSHYSRRLSVDHATMGNIWGRIMFNEEKQVLFLNFENLKIESLKHLENIASCIQLLITKSMDKKKKGNNMEGTIKCFLNDDDLDCDAHLFEIYTQTVHMNPLFDSVTRYTNKSLLSDHQRKIQKSLKDCEVYVKTCPCILDRFVFMVDDLIGKGTYGTVSLAMDLSLGRKVAVKRLCKKTVRLIGIEEYVKNEMEIMKILKENPHPNIVQVLDLHESEYEYLFVMEHLAGGCLDNPYDECEAFAENQVQRYFCQLVDAICHLHTNLRVLHRDIQASNCCFLDAEKKIVKLVDFGLSCLSTDFSKKEHTLFCGNSNYACPELLLKKAYGPEIDVYALGVLLYKMLFGCLPFRGAQQKLMMQYTVPLDGSSEDSMFMDDGVKISKPCQELIEKILEVNGDKRFSLQDIKNHEWYRNGKDQMETSNE